MVPSLRLEIEQAMGLKFPERNGAAVIKFEESMEIPQTAEILMRGLYRDPERVRQGFKRLHQETGSMIELLMPRRSRLREWSESLPERPEDAEVYLQETTDQLQQNEERLVQTQRELVGQLQESTLDDIFPLSLTAFALCNYREPCVKLFLKPLGKFAEMFQMNPETLRQVVRVHFLCLLLIISGADLDGQVCKRGSEEQDLVHWLASIYTIRYLKAQTAEFTQCYTEWLKAWGGKLPESTMSQEGINEKTRTALIFWRRQMGISWEACWQIVKQFEPAGCRGTDYN